MSEQTFPPQELGAAQTHVWRGPSNRKGPLSSVICRVLEQDGPLRWRPGGQVGGPLQPSIKERQGKRPEVAESSDSGTLWPPAVATCDI